MTSRLIQARLHSAQSGEDDALAIFDHYVEAGYTPRQIITQALLALEGQPIHEPDELVAVRQMFEALTELLDTRFDELKTMTPADRRRYVDETSKSTFHSSIRQAVDVVEYEGE